MAILSHLQATMVGQVIPDGSELSRHLDATDHYKEIHRFAVQFGGIARDAPAGVLPNIHHSHVLRWSRSTIAFSKELRTSQAQMDRVNGWVAPHIAVSHPPGHQNDMEAILRAVRTTTRYAKGADLPVEPSPANYRLHVAGTTDYIFPLAENHAKQAKSAKAPLHLKGGILPTRLMIQTWTELPEAMKNHGNGKTRHFCGWATTLGVPVPVIRSGGNADVFHQPTESNHNPLVKTILQELRGILFPFAMDKDPPNATLSGGYSPAWAFCIDELRLKTRMMGIPVEVRRSLVLLYENFSDILANPLLFDVVLDLYDVMATLYLMLVDLPGNPDTDSHPEHYTPRLSPEEVDGLNSILEAVDSALELRQRHLYPEDPIRDWSLDFRSNILQIILSAEAALKCSVGLHRKFVRGSDQVIPGLGVIHQVAFASSITMPKNDFGHSSVTKSKYHLAQFRSGVSHLTHLTGFADFFHESFHLSFKEKLKEQVGKVIENDLKNPVFKTQQAWRTSDPDHLRATLLKLHSEVFVHLSMILFVYDGDWKLALRSHAAAYSSNSRSAAPDARIALFSFPAQFSPILIAAMLVKRSKDKVSKSPTVWWAQNLDCPTLEESKAFFVEGAEILRPWLADFEWMRTAKLRECLPDDWMIGALQRHYLDVHDQLETMWNFATRTYWAFVRYVVLEKEGKPPKNPNSPPPLVDALMVKKFKKLIAQFDGVLKSSIDTQNGIFTAPLGCLDEVGLFQNGYCHDAALIACRTLRFHLASALDESAESGKSRFLHRQPDNGKIDWDTMGSPASMLIDRTSTAFFCCRASHRRMRTGARVVIFKTFWDIASRNRGRRLRSLMTQATSLRQPVRSGNAS